MGASRSGSSLPTRHGAYFLADYADEEGPNGNPCRYRQLTVTLAAMAVHWRFFAKRKLFGLAAGCWILQAAMDALRCAYPRASPVLQLAHDGASLAPR